MNLRMFPRIISRIIATLFLGMSYNTRRSLLSYSLTRGLIYSTYVRMYVRMYVHGEFSQ